MPLRNVRSAERGARVRVVAPSSPFPPEKLAAGVRRLEEAGFVVDDTTDVLSGTHAYLNGDDEARARALVDALSADVDVVWLARGGYGLTRIVDAIDLPANELPIVVGFSDATALACALLARGAPMVHGPLATTVAAEPAASFEHLLAVLGKRATGRAIEGLVRRAGRGVVEGPLVGGNLCVLAALVGTPALPSLDGAILVLEEIGERPYRVDRMLTQLLRSGALRGVRGVVVGHLTNCEEPPSSSSSLRDPAPRALDVVVERLGGLDVPVASGLPFGHEAPNYALPIGCRARLDVDAGALTLLADLP